MQGVRSIRKHVKKLIFRVRRPFEQVLKTLQTPLQVRTPNNKLESLPDSFSEISVAGGLALNDNKLKSLPEGFSEITVAGNVYLYGNPQLTGVPENFPNVKRTVNR